MHLIVFNLHLFLNVGFVITQVWQGQQIRFPVLIPRGGGTPRMEEGATKESAKFGWEGRRGKCGPELYLWFLWEETGKQVRRFSIQ